MPSQPTPAAHANYAARVKHTLLAFALTACALWCTPATLAQRTSQGLNFIDEINTRFGPRAGVESADDVLFPTIIAMQPAPRALPNLEAASLLVPGNSDWDVAEQWATAPEQAAVLEAVDTITNPRVPYEFTLHYWTQDVAQEYIDEGLYIDIEPINLLTMAEYTYLERLDDVSKLITVEATRLAELGEDAECLDLLVNWFRLGRLVAERGMSLEKYWGMGTMLVALERMRDVVYLYPFSFSESTVADFLRRMTPGAVRLDRITLPEGDRIAARQLIARTMQARGPIAVGTFSATMALIESEGRELTMTDKAAFYRNEIAPGHAAYEFCMDQIDNLFGDWEKRWEFPNPHDQIHSVPTDFLRMDKGQYYALMIVLSDIEWLYSLRLALNQELLGTQAGIGLATYRENHRDFPRNIAAISPKPVPRVRGDTIPMWGDLFHWNVRFSRYEDMKYFVPIRDRYDPNDIVEPEPHEITIVGGTLFELFSNGRPDDVGLAAAQLASVNDVGIVDVGAATNADALLEAEDFDGQGVGMGAGGSTELLGLAINEFGQQLNIAGVTFPDDLIDAEARTINADSLKQLLLDILVSSGVTQEMRQDFIRTAREGVMGGTINPSAIGTSLKPIIRQGIANPFVAPMLEEAGVSATRLAEVLENIAEAALNGPALKQAYASALNTGAVTDEQLIAANTEIINGAITQPLIDPIVDIAIEALVEEYGEEDTTALLRAYESILKSIASASVDNVTGTSLERFTAKITQSQCILYSIGPDQIDGQARRVGLRGTDVLYWPPVLSLKREYLELGEAGF